MNILLLIASFLFLSNHILSSGTEPSTGTEASLPLVKVNPILSDKDVVAFREAFLNDNMDAAIITYYSSSHKIRDHLANVAIDFGVTGIAELFKTKSIHAQRWMVGIFLRHGDKSFVNELLGKLSLSDVYLESIMSEACLEDTPDKFVNAIEQIEDHGQRKTFVKKRITSIARKKSQYIIPIISELGRDKSILSLRNAAVVYAFDATSCYSYTTSIAKQLSDHPSISTDIYASAIDKSWSYKHAKGDPFFFFWLLNRADHQTLESLKKSSAYEKFSEYQHAVDEALETASSDSLHVIGRRDTTAFIMAILGFFFPEVLSKIVLEYYFEW